jgi:hypothetical protein
MVMLNNLLRITMKNFILGVLLTLSATSWSLTTNPDGSVMLDKDEVRNINLRWETLNQNFNLCVAQVGALRAKLESLEQAKCS